MPLRAVRPPVAWPRRGRQSRTTIHPGSACYRDTPCLRSVARQTYIRVVTAGRQPVAYTELMRTTARADTSEKEALRFDRKLKRLIQEARTAPRTSPERGSSPTFWRQSVADLIEPVSRSAPPVRRRGPQGSPQRSPQSGLLLGLRIWLRIGLDHLMANLVLISRDDALRQVISFEHFEHDERNVVELVRSERDDIDRVADLEFRY